MKAGYSGSENASVVEMHYSCTLEWMQKSMRHGQNRVQGQHAQMQLDAVCSMLITDARLSDEAGRQDETAES